MSHALITRLVVGEPTPVSLGRPVAQSVAHGAGRRTLRWRAGAWVGANRRLTTWLALLVSSCRSSAIEVRATSAPRLPLRRWQGLLAAAVLVSSFGAALHYTWRAVQAPTSSDLPIAPATSTAQPPVRVVADAYVPPSAGPVMQRQPALPIAGPEAAPILPLPLAAPPKPAPTQQSLPESPKPAAAPAPRQEPIAAPATMREQAPAAKQIAAAPPTPAPAAKGDAKQREQQPVSAVVLDEVAPRTGRGSVGTVVAAAAQPTKGPAAPPAPTAATAAPKPAPERGRGLIAITPDGQVAFFTNPKTRLPQQFRIGDQLPGGDTVRSIDVKEGKVVTTSKEYALD